MSAAGPATQPTNRSALAVSLVVGWASIAYGVLQVDALRVDRYEFGVWFVGALLVHDVLLAPAVFAAGWVLGRVVPARALPLVQGALILSGVAILYALPSLLGPGPDPGNPSRLPNDYGRNLFLTVTVVWAIAAVPIVRAWHHDPSPSAVRPRPRILPRRVELALGAVAGLVAGGLVGALMAQQDMMGEAPLGPSAGGGGVVAELLVWVAVGALYAAVVGYAPDAGAAAVSSGMLAGLLTWTAWPLTLVPASRGDLPTWSVEAAAEAFPLLIGYVIFGVMIGALVHVGGAVVLRRRPLLAAELTTPAPNPPRVVILGGGFAGVSAAQRLEQLFPQDGDLDITLVSESNYLLFTPMLAGVAASTLDPRHISAPVRASCRYTRFRRARATTIDPERSLVTLSAGFDVADEQIAFDHLVLALGSVPATASLPEPEHAFQLKTLEDATSLRDQVLASLEQADVESDRRARRDRLSFVVAGGGFAGTELVAELRDLVHDVLHLYPGIGRDEPSFTLLHTRDRILPEIGPELAAYALGKLRGRGVEVLLGARVTDVTADGVHLADGRRLATRTVVWTAGTRPHPLLDGLPGDRAPNGALLTDATLRLPAQPNVWGIGDCVAIPDADNPGETYPPTAQHALREGAAVAENIAAVLGARATAPFRFRTIATLVGLGHRTAVGEVQGLRFSGLAAWILWRSVYLAKLPGLDKKTRVLADWAIGLAFPRDVVVTRTPDTRRTGGPDARRHVEGPV